MFHTGSNYKGCSKSLSNICHSDYTQVGVKPGTKVSWNSERDDDGVTDW